MLCYAMPKSSISYRECSEIPAGLGKVWLQKILEFPERRGGGPKRFSVVKGGVKKFENFKIFPGLSAGLEWYLTLEALPLQCTATVTLACLAYRALCVLSYILLFYRCWISTIFCQNQKILANLNNFIFVYWLC